MSPYSMTLFFVFCLFVCDLLALRKTAELIAADCACYGCTRMRIRGGSISVRDPYIYIHHSYCSLLASGFVPGAMIGCALAPKVPRDCTFCLSGDCLYPRIHGLARSALMQELPRCAVTIQIIFDLFLQFLSSLDADSPSRNGLFRPSASRDHGVDSSFIRPFRTMHGRASGAHTQNGCAANYSLIRGIG